jgi:hypothetical protein
LGAARNFRCTAARWGIFERECTNKGVPSAIPPEVDKQSIKAPLIVNGANDQLISFSFALDSGNLVPAKCEAEPLQDGPNFALIGYLSPDGKVSDLNIPYFAMLDGQYRVRWAGRLAFEHPRVRAEITIRRNQLFGFCPSGENQVLVANFTAESMTADKAVQVELARLINGPMVELPGTFPLPPIVTIVQRAREGFWQ